MLPVFLLIAAAAFGTGTTINWVASKKKYEAYLVEYERIIAELERHRGQLQGSLEALAHHLLAAEKHLNRGQQILAPGSPKTFRFSFRQPEPPPIARVGILNDIEKHKEIVAAMAGAGGGAMVQLRFG